MESKTFRAANLQAALEEIREELGPNASVLSTKQCRDGWMGWLGHSYVEVTASPDDPHDSESTLPIEAGAGQGGLRLALGTMSGTDRRLDLLGRTSSVDELQRQIDSRQIIPGHFGDASRPDRAAQSDHPKTSTFHYRTEWDPLSEYRFKMVSLGVDPHVVDRWIRSTSDFASGLSDPLQHSWLEKLQQAVCRDIRVSGPIAMTPGDRRIVALVGPTGVGKTTTVAKLAAGFHLDQKQRVGLLTIDTFRIAAIQQLQAYAQLMDLPMQVVESAEKMPAAIEQLGDVDLILIDTAGRSPSGEVHIEKLSRILQVAQPDETHLVISATSTASVVHSVIDGFSVARPTAAVLTKLDETPYTAGVLSAIACSDERPGIPVSYVTNGQHVPQDIASATTDALVERLLPSPIQWAQKEAA
ncbi:flagellar biosynthesis protein FlhF [Rhodopirellula sp. MGV]|uniref:flagellar biosynthesis protein FlhF n=1 Tax=Rhodopirellula sp. MGV TaxID=2023130 RepID=UPI000B96336A|nr:flagellar biosynthesis protein FlhF [Rhodopirellula sp. MGV]OYP30370.1 flagellar biosynthesis protein FlhF [Rhodopirellula sp. MGV]PNY34727.1 flagellar biosynthesis protein FlhF [Rhodopirellula baltica]